MNPLNAILPILDRLEILIPLVIGIVILIPLLIHRSRRNIDTSSPDPDSIQVISGGEGEAAGAREGGIIGNNSPKLEARILEALKAGGMLKPLPIPASKEGGHYPGFAGVSEKDFKAAVNGLIEKGLIGEGEREFSAVACPVCGSCSQVAMISCRNCGSLRLSEVRYYRHGCGFIGPEPSFRSGSSLKCPQCGSSENVEVYRRRYKCLDCGSEFDEPLIAFKCGSCGAFYDEHNMGVKHFNRIKSSRAMLREYDLVNQAIEARIELLRREGYIIERPVELVGESGTVYTFDAMAKRGGERIAIASTFGESVGQALLRFGLARGDLKLNKVILVAGRPISQAERKLAESLGIEVVEAEASPPTPGGGAGQDIRESIDIRSLSDHFLVKGYG